MQQFLFQAHLIAKIEVTAKTETDAREELMKLFDGARIDLNQPIDDTTGLTEDLTLNGVPSLIELNGKNVED